MELHILVQYFSPINLSSPPRMQFHLIPSILILKVITLALPLRHLPPLRTSAYGVMTLEGYGLIMVDVDS